MENITIAIIEWYDDEITTYTSTDKNKQEIIRLYEPMIVENYIKDIQFANVDI